MKPLYRVLVTALIITAAVIFFRFLIGGNPVALFNPAGPVAAQEKDVIITMVLLMLIIVVPMFVFLFTFAWKYRADNKNSIYDPERTHGPLRELVLWAIPAVLIAVLGVINWNSAHAIDPYKPLQSANPPLTIQVVALPWKWLFIYPAQNIATINFIQIPEQTPIHFELTADGPISSFWIPQLGSQIYAMAAMQTQLQLMASTTGEFVGKDTEINGEGYAGMTFLTKSTSQADFDAWVAEVKQTSSTLDLDAYNALAIPSENNPSTTFASVSGDLFNGIMMKFMAPSSSGQMHMQAMPGMTK